MWYYLGVATGLMISFLLSRKDRGRPDYVSDGWLANHHQAEGHQDGWLQRRGR